jgi:hypothetical protein
MDERYWLLTTCYNTGIECLQYGFALHTHACHSHMFPSVCLLDDARRWFEASGRICRYVPDGTVRAKKVRHPPISNFIPILPEGQITDTYTHLMNRYGS